MKVVWDPAKAKLNWAKHGVHLSDAETAPFDPHALTKEDESSQGERRFVTLGSDASGKVLVAVYACRGEFARLISSRKATRREREQYEKGI